jgi:hypothetical protein
MNANGFRLYSLLDDGRVGEDVPDLLGQVSSVVEWSRRDEWIKALA